MRSVVFAIAVRTLGGPKAIGLLFRWVAWRVYTRMLLGAVVGIPRAVFYVHRSPPCCYRACAAPWGDALWLHYDPGSRSTYWTITMRGKRVVWRRLGDEP